MSLPRIGLHELIEDHYQDLYWYAYRLSGQQSDAEDLTQETFTKVISRLNQLKDSDNPRPWLFRILRNLYLHKIRDSRAKYYVPLDDAGELPETLNVDEFPIDSAELQLVLNELEESFRTPLILYYFEEFSYRDIAEQMNLPIGTVMSRLARAKAFLRSRLYPVETPSENRVSTTHAHGGADHGL